MIKNVTVKLQEPREVVYLVVTTLDNGDLTVVAAFTKSDTAERFIDKCGELVSSGQDVRFGSFTITNKTRLEIYNACCVTNGKTTGIEEVPLFTN